jgi:hypothetical protein
MSYLFSTIRKNVIVCRGARCYVPIGDQTILCFIALYRVLLYTFVETGSSYLTSNVGPTKVV